MSTRRPDNGEIEGFESKAAWATWLEEHHGRSAGLWLRMAKKGSGTVSLSYKDALEVALCYGWIDGQRRPESAEAYRIRFVPRSGRSLWSKINREKALALIASQEMKAAGLRAVETARQNGQWEAAYDSPSDAEVPEDLQEALQASPRAQEFFEALNRTNRYAVLWRIQTARKPETRARKIVEMVAKLERREKFHP